MKSDQPYLGHIADCMDAIEKYVGGDRDRFIRERIVQDAVIRNFEVTPVRPPVACRQRRGST